MNWGVLIVFMSFLVLMDAVADHDDLQLSDFVNTITSQLKDALLTPRKYLERKKIVMKPDFDKLPIVKNDTAVNSPGNANLGIDLTDPVFTMPSMLFKMSTRIVYLHTTDDHLIHIEESEETEDSTHSESEDYGPFE